MPPPIVAPHLARRRSPLLAILLAAALPASAGGQTVGAPSTVTPQTLRPDTPLTTPTVEVPDAPGLTPPPGTDALRITPGKVAVEGVFPRVGDEVTALARTVEHRTISPACPRNGSSTAARCGSWSCTALSRGWTRTRCRAGCARR